MSLAATGAISEVVSASLHYPLRTAAIAALLVLGPLVLKWIFSDLKLEHLLPFTLNNRIKSVKAELKDNLMDAPQRANLLGHYHRLLNQKNYRIKNPLLQQALIGVIHHSSDIVEMKYYRPHQFILSLNDAGQVFVDRKKVAQRRFEAVLLLVISLVGLVLGLAVSKLFAPLGLAILLLALILYFAILGHFPANSRVRKELQNQFNSYYAHQDKVSQVTTKPLAGVQSGVA